MKRIINVILPVFGKRKVVKYVSLGILAGALNFLFINCVTRVMNLIIHDSSAAVNREYLFVFPVIILLIILTRRTLSLGIIHSSQTLFWKLRKDILSSVLNSDYQQLFSKKTQVNTALLRDVYTLTEASMSIIMFFTSLVLSIACFVYLAVISPLLCLITLVIAGLGITVYQFNSKKNSLHFKKSRLLENKFLENLQSMLNGFKEINMDPRKGKYIYQQKIDPISEEAFNNDISAYAGFLSNQITGQVLFYILISSVLLVFGAILHIKAGDIVSFVFTLLYLLSSIETIMGSLPSLSRAKVAALNMLNLRAELEEQKSNNRMPLRYIPRTDFDHLSIKDMEFHYNNDDASFRIGPVNLDIKKGEVIFIYGGNGSGKTTFIHSIIGVRIPTSGAIYLNDILISEDNYPEYKTLFSVVFSDFYLFNELIGVSNFDHNRWEFYLRLFELENKVTLEDNAFSTTDLSTGQRKRLALIVALMEDKPVLVIDEWAADQDPYFRKKFYTEIIPLLKEDGVTIIAITHDDKYYHCADKLFKMDYGKLTEQDANVRYQHIEVP